MSLNDKMAEKISSAGEFAFFCQVATKNQTVQVAV